MSKTSSAPSSWKALTLILPFSIHGHGMDHTVNPASRYSSTRHPLPLISKIRTLYFGSSPPLGGGINGFWNGGANVPTWGLKFGVGEIIWGLKFRGPKRAICGLKFGVGEII